MIGENGDPKPASVFERRREITDEERAAWRARKTKSNNLFKDGFGRIEIERIRRDAVINFALDFGLCVRPIGRPLTFKEARKAFETWALQMVEDRSRVKLKSLLSKLPADFIYRNAEGDS